MIAPARLSHAGSFQRPTPGHQRHLRAFVRVVYFRRPLYFVYFHFLSFRRLPLDVFSHLAQLLQRSVSDIFPNDFWRARSGRLPTPPRTPDNRVYTHNSL